MNIMVRKLVCVQAPSSHLEIFLEYIFHLFFLLLQTVCLSSRAFLTERLSILICRQYEEYLLWHPERFRLLQQVVVLALQVSGLYRPLLQADFHLLHPPPAEQRQLDSWVSRYLAIAGYSSALNWSFLPVELLLITCSVARSISPLCIQTAYDCYYSVWSQGERWPDRGDEDHAGKTDGCDSITTKPCTSICLSNWDFLSLDPGIREMSQDIVWQCFLFCFIHIISNIGISVQCC